MATGFQTFAFHTFFRGDAFHSGYYFRPLLLSVSAVFGGVLMSFKQFVAYSLSPIFYNIGIICGALFFAPLVGVVGLAWGVVFGSFMHMMIQYPSLRRLGFRYRPPFFIIWK